MNVDTVSCNVQFVVTFSKNKEEHLIHLDNVFAISVENGLSLRIKKCSFMQPKVKLLGSMVDSQVTHDDIHKIEKI